MESSQFKPSVLASISKPAVLVVDDAPENLMVMEAILSDLYSLKLISDAKEALEYAIATPPDLILLDVMMPDIDGFEVCRLLKANKKLADVPVIFVTAKNDVRDEELGFSVGASDFIHKPISAPVVAARVRTHLKIKFVLDYLRKENVRLQDNVGQTSSDLEKLKELLWGGQFLKN